MASNWILDDNDEVIEADSDAWSRWRWSANGRGRRRIARDEINDVLVSTVFIGLDFSLGEGAPMVFETMIFGGPYNERTEWSATKADALAVHAKAVALVRSEGLPRAIRQSA